MSRDPWAALEAQRRRRHWRQWPWGWVAVAFSLLMWAALAYAVLLAAGSMRMPGDGAAPRWQHTLAWACLNTAVVSGVASAVTTVLGWRLRRARGAAMLAGLLLIALALLLGGVALIQL
ncbi:hypothetical protein [Stenotrophomonas sp.]|uniref:hypothetical protein n=1 Tax=Stenotrophomonas sp. TaxID=69392 RepID=UPI00289931D2|nr:hypothetical protein [Stenotrophomonas sp.]